MTFACTNNFKGSIKMKPNYLWQLVHIVLVWGCVALGLLSLSSCKEEMASPSIVGYNHTKDRSIYYFTVDGNMGSMLLPESGGGKFSCCASIPRKWHPGIKVKVGWEYQDYRGIPAPQPEVRSVDVEVPEYGDRNGIFAVHFFDNHVVKLYVGTYGIDHADYPAELKWNSQLEVTK